MLVDSTDGNQGRDRHPIRARKAVGENDTLYSTDAKIALHRTGCLVANSIDRVEHALCPTAYGHGAVDDSGTEDVLSIFLVNLVFDSPHLFEGHDRLTNDKAGTVLWSGIGEHVSFGSHGAHERHNELLPDGVDGGVGDLGKELLEVVRDSAGLSREHSKCGVVTHGSEGFFSADRHGKKEHLHSLRRVPEHVEPSVGGCKVELVPLRAGLLRPALQVDRVLEPLCVRALGSDLLLDLIVRDDAGGVKVHKEHLSGFKPVLNLDLRVGQLWTNSNLRGKHHVVVVCNIVPGGPQTVAVEGGTDVTSVSEGNHGGSIPGFHDVTIELIKGLLGVGEVLVVLPGLRDHHHDTLWE
mmetsp:Transcript_16220/g.33308  ORF Transcript_16220/g.33308 Transcript_16220/m.33308 type:complete len:353 (+) Transcript_16220:2712-3770(+)